jgi:hypothetical protein
MEIIKHFHTIPHKPHGVRLKTLRGNWVFIPDVVELYWTDDVEPEPEPEPELPEFEWVDCYDEPANIDEIASIVAEYGACEVEFQDLYSDKRHRHKVTRYERDGRYDALFYEINDVPYNALETYWAPWLPVKFNGGTAMSRAVTGHQRRKQQ